MGSVSGLIQMGIWAAVAASLWFGYHTWTGNLREEGAKAQMEADLVIIQQCKADLQTAKTANETLRKDLDQLKIDIETVNAEVSKIEEESKKTQAAKDAALQITGKNLVKLDAQRQEALARAEQFQLNGETCEQRLSNLGSRMRNLADRELRERPPTGSGAGGSAVGSAQGAGAPPVRVQ
jgi:chromosome segregation ATPase